MLRGWIVLLAALLLLAAGVATRNWRDWRAAQEQVRELQTANQDLENEKRSLERAQQVLEKENSELVERTKKSEEKAQELQTEIRRVVAAAPPKPAPAVRVTPEVALDGAWPSVGSAAIAGNFRAPRRRGEALGELTIEHPPIDAAVEIPLRVWVDTNGRVENVEAVGERTELALLAEAEIQKLSYEPARHKGGPTSADMYLRLVFAPDGE